MDTLPFFALVFLLPFPDFSLGFDDVWLGICICNFGGRFSWLNMFSSLTWKMWRGGCRFFVRISLVLSLEETPPILHLPSM
jgi:hypothetical protein